MRTAENNKLIAEFMGFKLQDNPNERFYNKWIINSNAYGGRYSFEEFYFDVDWNWLMEVVEKIESILLDDNIITIEYKSCYIPVLEDEEPFTIEGIGETKIKAVYNACVTFIEWHNKQK